jgi:hypothetical protein
MSLPELWRVKSVEPIDGLRAVEIPEHLPHFTAVFSPARPRQRKVPGGAGRSAVHRRTPVPQAALKGGELEWGHDRTS